MIPTDIISTDGEMIGHFHLFIVPAVGETVTIMGKEYIASTRHFNISRINESLFGSDSHQTCILYVAHRY